MRGILLEYVLNSSCSCKSCRCPFLRNEWLPTSLDEGISHTAYSEEFHKNRIKFNYMATHFPICQLDYLYCQCVLSPVIPVEREKCHLVVSCLMSLFCTLGDLNICRWTVVLVLLKAGACQEKLNKLCLVSSPYYQKTDLWAMDLRFDPGDGSAV